MRYTLTPYAGSKAGYDAISGDYDTIVDCFAGSLGGTLKTAIANPNCRYLVAEKSPHQRALIQGLAHHKDYYDVVKSSATQIIDNFFKQENYQSAAKWLSNQYNTERQRHFENAALSVLRRFFFSCILRTTPGTGNINVWISIRKILGDSTWKRLVTEWFPHVDYKNLNTQGVKDFNAELAETLFVEREILHTAMVKQVETWYKSVSPVLDEWFSISRHIEVYSDYRDLIFSRFYSGGRTLMYIDPPYYNPHSGTFVDEAGRKRCHKQTASYPGHHPQSEETWRMFSDPVHIGVSVGADMVLCNYVSEPFKNTLDKLAEDYQLEVLVENKSCLCTGKRSKYTVAPQGREFVVFATPKVEL